MRRIILGAILCTVTMYSGVLGSMAVTGDGLEAKAMPARQPTIYKGFPFGEMEAKRRQTETAKVLGIPVNLVVELPYGVRMNFMLIPAGEFMMGASKSEMEELDESEQRKLVRITKPFYMAMHECTEEQWQAITQEFSFHFRDNPRLPFVGVSWKDIDSNLMTRIQHHAPEGMHFRLPTEAEWEYACRAGTSTPFHFGNAITTDLVNFNDVSYSAADAEEDEHRMELMPVGSFPPNPWGLHDMHGNVWEWCRDWHDPDYYTNMPEDNPENTTPSMTRVLRGGSWFVDGERCRSAARTSLPPSHRDYNDIGFRLVLELP